MLQPLKYFLVRIGISLFLLLGFGFFVLYFIHEIALPQVEFDDASIQWALLFICVFLGFSAYGLIGEQRFHNSFHVLRDIRPDKNPAPIIQRFEYLLYLTHSSYFLPSKGRRFREQVVGKYADYLLLMGREDSAALKIYLKAFLQDPKDSRFRAPLLTLLRQGGDLSDKEIDLLLVMLAAENYQDDFITDHLTEVFLQRKKFTARTESLFLNALRSDSPRGEEIIRFVVPPLLAHNRTDPHALQFYLHALRYSIPGAERMRDILARRWCEGILEGIDPVLHEKCGRVFHSLEPGRQDRIREAVENSTLGGKWKKVRLFTREDSRQLEHLKRGLGIDRSLSRRLGEGVLGIVQRLADWGRRGVLQSIDGLIAFTRLPLRVKAITLSVLFVFLLAGLSYKGWYEQKSGPSESGSPPGKVQLPPPASQIPQVARVHTIQVAAVTSSSQANKMIRLLKRKGVDRLYIVKSPRQAGGNWYKIRIGRFEGKEEALRLAHRLIEKKTIKNYFVISMPREPDLKK